MRQCAADVWVTVDNRRRAAARAQRHQVKQNLKGPTGEGSRAPQPRDGQPAAAVADPALAAAEGANDASFESLEELRRAAGEAKRAAAEAEQRASFCMDLNICVVGGRNPARKIHQCSKNCYKVLYKKRYYQYTENLL